jgi:histidine triad (HIT) family protein
MTDCLFCKIVQGVIPADVVYQDDKVVAFRDINPKAPYHILVIPKVHLSSVLEFTEEHQEVMVHVFKTLKELATRFDEDQLGFRVVTNTGPSGGQTVDHLHFHFLAGRTFSWPPG